MTTQDKPMMIALEGTKGSGKSTLFQKLLSQEDLLPVKPFTYRPTAPAPNYLPVARKLAAYPEWATQDDWQEKLYAERAEWHARQIPANAPFILADRCIATSYATRWHKWGDPEITIQKVDALHTCVPMPDLVLWLDCPPELALQRIAMRPQRNYGLADQCPQRISETYAAYREIMVQPPHRLAATKWIRLDASQPLDTLVNEAFDILDYHMWRSFFATCLMTA